MDKRGVSELIATVLLIGVTISAAAMIYSFVVPLIQNNIEQSQKCVSGLLEIIPDYTCYNISTKELYIEIERGDMNVNVTGIQILVSGGQSSGGVLVKENAVTNEIREYGNPTAVKREVFGSIFIRDFGGGDIYIDAECNTWSGEGMGSDYGIGEGQFIAACIIKFPDKGITRTIENGTLECEGQTFIRRDCVKETTMPVMALPKKGESNTYVINMTALGFAPESATASPLVKLKTGEKLCSVSSQIPVGNC